MTPDHGTFERWMAGCWCDPCFAASKRVREAKQPGSPGRPRVPIAQKFHGSRATYNAGCRCGKCVNAEHRYQREYYRRNLERKRAQGRAKHHRQQARKRTEAA